MGWYAFVPFMECYHSVVSMSHFIEGSADFGSGDTDFMGGKGYHGKRLGKIISGRLDMAAVKSFQKYRYIVECYSDHPESHGSKKHLRVLYAVFCTMKRYTYLPLITAQK